MNRRIFFRNSILGLGGLYGLAGNECASVAQGQSKPFSTQATSLPASGELFHADTKSDEWGQFPAAGFSQSVCGVVYRKEHEVLNGMPLGGIATGYLDLETDGTFGLCSLFNSGVPVRDLLHVPFLGMSIGDETWVLTTRDMLRAGNAADIHYWGHYPVADLEYQTTAPVGVGLRAWSPFLPGDAYGSNIPAAVFEVHLRNHSKSSQSGTLAFNFPGPTQAEAQISANSPRIKRTLGWPANEPVADGVAFAHRAKIDEPGLQGLSISSDQGTSYVLGVLTQEESLRFGGPLFFNAYDAVSDSLWRSIKNNLPRVTDSEFGTSMSVNFTLGAGETKVVRIVLAWHSPIWRGEGSHSYKRMYAKQYGDALSVARIIAGDHQDLLSRILAWQQTVYAETDLPVWLRDSLVNILHLFAKTGYWAQSAAPIGVWSHEDTGLFAMSECPRECPNIECLPCSFYGNIALVYFFPELALSTLRGYKAFQSPEGASAMLFGGASGGTDGAELATPGGYDYQTTLNGPCYVDMVDRYWQRTGDHEFLKEFYESARKSTIYTMELGDGPYGIVSMPKDNVNPQFDPSDQDPGTGKPHSPGKPGYHLDWFEEILWFGLTPHVGGIHLAQVRMAQRMAESIGDAKFVEQCKGWLQQGSEAIESRLWAGQYYLAYHDTDTGKKSDLVFGYQLDGDWMCFFHGLPGVFQPQRAKIALETIKRTCMRMSSYGPVNFARPDGLPAPNSVGYGSLAFFPPEVWMLASTFMYQGQRDLGIQIAHNCMQNFVRRGYTWTQPNIIDAKTGKRVYGSDYYQNMMLWALPAAIGGTSIAQFSGHGSFVDRVIRAAAKT